MIDPKLEQAINDQINTEFSAAYGYLAMATHFDEQNLEGFSSWMHTQHDEEIAHGMRLFRYLQDRGGKVTLEAIPKPRTEFENVLAVFKVALETEEANTRAINGLYELATQLSDHATKSHLQWFLDEQVEEEKSIEEVIALLELAGTDASAILYLNDKLGTRKPDSNAAEAG